MNFLQLNLGTVWWGDWRFDANALFLGRYLLKASHALPSATCDYKWHLWYHIRIRFYQIFTSIFSYVRKDDCDACWRRHTGVDESTISAQKSVGRSWSYLGRLSIMILIHGRENWCQSFLCLSKMGNDSSLIYICTSFKILYQMVWLIGNQNLYDSNTWRIYML
jgi:hypothetical protein